jgi:hypothetical protein
VQYYVATVLYYSIRVVASYSSIVSLAMAPPGGALKIPFVRKNLFTVIYLQVSVKVTMTKSFRDADSTHVRIEGETPSINATIIKLSSLLRRGCPK